MTAIERVKQALGGYKGKNLKIMEVCGSHTAAIIKSGIRNHLPNSIRLVSGPGCPVCVTSPAYMDAACEAALMPGHVLVTFGDMMKVPGRNYSLYDARAAGGRVEIVYSPLAILEKAEKNPGTVYVMAAVGFETTAPVYAVLIDEAVRREIRNIRLLTAVKTIIPAMESILRSEEIDGFICPGHVGAIIGAKAFRPLAGEYGKPMVISGFEGCDVLVSLLEIVRQVDAGIGEVRNLYPAVVTEDGNNKALSLIGKYFEPCDAVWRGIGSIPGSGLALRPEYRAFRMDYDDAFAEEAGLKGCRCADVIKGRINPDSCPLFGKACTPSKPQGACMVSSEGACGIWYSQLG